MSRKVEHPATLAGCLRIAPEFRPDDKEGILGVLGKLDRRLTRFEARDVEMELSMKDRDKRQQRVTLEAWIGRLGHLVATSKEADLRAALMDVREDMWEAIDKALGRRRKGG